MNESATPNALMPSFGTDVPRALEQLRVAVVVLGGLLLVVNVALTAFVAKQNHHYHSQMLERQRLAGQLQQSQRAAGGALQELGQLSQSRPELRAIFERHDVQLNPAPSR